MKAPWVKAAPFAVLTILLFNVTCFLAPVGINAAYLLTHSFWLAAVLFLINVVLHFYLFFGVLSRLVPKGGEEAILNFYVVGSILSFLIMLWMIGTQFTSLGVVKTQFLGRGVLENTTLAKVYERKDEFAYFQIKAPIAFSDQVGYTFHKGTSQANNVTYYYTERLLQELVGDGLPKYATWLMYETEWSSSSPLDPRRLEGYEDRVEWRKKLVQDSLQSDNILYFTISESTNKSQLAYYDLLTVEVDDAPDKVMVLQFAGNPKQEMREDWLYFIWVPAIVNILLLLLCIWGLVKIK